MVDSFKMPEEPIPRWLFDEVSKDGLEEDPDKPLDPWRFSVEVGGRIGPSMFPEPIADALAPSKYAPDVSFWVFSEDLKKNSKHVNYLN